jgi:murein DD-endopeptidase MepM/ murein hydrolase activator NlpD
LNYSPISDRFFGAGRLLFVVIILLVCVTAFAYAYLAPHNDNYFPFSCNLPAVSPQFRDHVVESGAPRDASDPEDAPCRSEGGMEMTDVTGQGDTIESVLGSNIEDEAVVKRVGSVLASSVGASLKKKFYRNSPLPPGRRYSVTVDRSGAFRKAVFELDPANVFHVVMEGDDIRSWKEDVVLDFRVEALSIPITGGLMESVLKAGEAPELALKLTTVLRWDIDFQSEAIKGDVCRVLFERRYADDQPSGYGRILAVAYQGKVTGLKTAFLFNDRYYDRNGVDLKKNFLRSPLNDLRVTSKFGYRLHPIQRVWRKHNGVDYGAPVGTPVWSIASGVVTFAGWQKGYGNYVCIMHDNGYESRYGHLQRMFVKKGQRVKQRQRVGLVGQTGEATGPHLDFQLLAKGKHLDPLKVKMVATLKTVPEPLRPRFAALAQERASALESLPAGGRSKTVLALNSP